MEMVIGPRVGTLGMGDLAQAYPWPASGRWVRAMMVTTLDGSATGPDGLSGSISSRADRAVLSEVRRLSDAVLIGAGTLRAERYTPMLAKVADAGERAALGLAPAPVVVVVSGSLDLPWDEPFFSDSAVRPIVITTESAEPGSLATARGHADVITVAGERVGPAAIIDALVGRGLNRIVCEGGPSLLSSLAVAELIDEADIAVSPMMVGNGHEAAGTPVLVRFHLAQVITEDGFLFGRYLAVDPGSLAPIASTLL
jgi:riboflavin biosynthesis pyrimidine reductase